MKECTSSNKINNIHTTYSIDKKIEVNISNFKKVLGKSDDIIFREFYFGEKLKTKALLCFVDGLYDKKIIDEYIVKPLMLNIHLIDQKWNLNEQQDLIYAVKNFVLNAVEISESNNFDSLISDILSGSTVLLIDGYDRALSFGAKNDFTRESQAAETEKTVRGPSYGFSELLRLNTTLLRRIIQNPNLTFESLKIGTQTNTSVSIAYIDGIADMNVVQEVRNRLKNIDTAFILESGYIEQFIEDHPLSPFSTVGNSERPDKVAAKLLEGRVAILCNGTPYVLTVPYLFIESLQVAEDYYSRTFLSSFIRLLRLLAYIFSLTLPSLYVAIAVFHQEMIPTALMVTVSGGREGLPFPIFIETILTEIVFQMVRESGLRMPQALGAAISIVGTLVIGEAAVNAGIIGAAMVIITALSAITSFIVTPVYDSLVLFRFILIILGGSFGLLGVSVGLLCMLAHMCSLNSFGTPFMMPVAPRKFSGLKDTFIRAPLWFMRKK
jgi:spore germination protein KA